MTLPRLLLCLVLASCTLGGAGVRVSEAPQGALSQSVARPGWRCGVGRGVAGLAVARVLPLAPEGLGSRALLRLRGGAYGQAARQARCSTISNCPSIPLLPSRVLLPFVDRKRKAAHPRTEQGS